MKVLVIRCNCSLCLVVGVFRGVRGISDMVFFFKQKTAYEMLRSLVGSEMCIRDRRITNKHPNVFLVNWKDIEDIVYSEIASNYTDNELQELENELP